MCDCERCLRGKAPQMAFCYFPAYNPYARKGWRYWLQSYCGKYSLVRSKSCQLISYGNLARPNNIRKYSRQWPEH
jgi:hypothetical protein